jgi:hypothetical protein
MYRFKHGKFKGMTMERSLLRDAPELYRVARWAKTQDVSHLAPLLSEFRRLRKQLRRAPILVRCEKRGCNREPKSMTLPLGADRDYLPSAHYWCAKHGPLENEGISPKLPISFDTIDSFDDRKNRRALHRVILRALGIVAPRRTISEKYARDYFSRLR